MHFAEFGVVLLLFIIGLELQPARLWTFRSAVFGLGGAQVVVGGHFLLRPVLHAVATTRTPELFTATALLIVCGTALLMNSIGISMALGAFLAGMLAFNRGFQRLISAQEIRLGQNRFGGLI